MSNTIHVPITSAEIDEQMAFADAALALAGHKVVDPSLREISRRAGLGRITTEQAIAEGLTHIDAR